MNSLFAIADFCVPGLFIHMRVEICPASFDDASHSAHSSYKGAPGCWIFPLHPHLHDHISIEQPVRGRGWDYWFRSFHKGSPNRKTGALASHKKQTCLRE